MDDLRRLSNRFFFLYFGYNFMPYNIQQNAPCHSPRRANARAIPAVNAARQHRNSRREWFVTVWHSRQLNQNYVGSRCGLLIMNVYSYDVCLHGHVRAFCEWMETTTEWTIHVRKRQFMLRASLMALIALSHFPDRMTVQYLTDEGYHLPTVSETIHLWIRFHRMNRH